MMTSGSTWTFLSPWANQCVFLLEMLFLSYVTAARSRQLCLTPCNPIDGSPTGSSVPGILQARTLEWVAIYFSNAWKWKVKVKSLSRVRLFATPWTVAYQAPPSMGFSRQEYWSGVPFAFSEAMLMNYVFTLDSFFKLVPTKTQKGFDKPVCFTLANVLLSYVNGSTYLLGNLPFFQDSCQLFYGPGWCTLCQCYLKMHVVGEGPGATLWVPRHFLPLIN